MTENTEATDTDAGTRERNGERRYERWQAANARADVRRHGQEKVALIVMAAAISIWTIVQFVL